MKFAAVSIRAVVRLGAFAALFVALWPSLVAQTSTEQATEAHALPAPSAAQHEALVAANAEIQRGCRHVVGRWLPE